MPLFFDNYATEAASKSDETYRQRRALNAKLLGDFVNSAKQSGQTVTVADMAEFIKSNSDGSSYLMGAMPAPAIAARMAEQTKISADAAELQRTNAAYQLDQQKSGDLMKTLQTDVEAGLSEAEIAAHLSSIHGDDQVKKSLGGYGGIGPAVTKARTTTMLQLRPLVDSLTDPSEVAGVMGWAPQWQQDMAKTMVGEKAKRERTVGMADLAKSVLNDQQVAELHRNGDDATQLITALAQTSPHGKALLSDPDFQTQLTGIGGARSSLGRQTAAKEIGQSVLADPKIHDLVLNGAPKDDILATARTLYGGTTHGAALFEDNKFTSNVLNSIQSAFMQKATKEDLTIRSGAVEVGTKRADAALKTNDGLEESSLGAFGDSKTPAELKAAASYLIKEFDFGGSPASLDAVNAALTKLKDKSGYNPAGEAETIAKTLGLKRADSVKDKSIQDVTTRLRGGLVEPGTTPEKLVAKFSGDAAAIVHGLSNKGTQQEFDAAKKSALASMQRVMDEAPTWFEANQARIAGYDPTKRFSDQPQVGKAMNTSLSAYRTAAQQIQAMQWEGPKPAVGFTGAPGATKPTVAPTGDGLTLTMPQTKATSDGKGGHVPARAMTNPSLQSMSAADQASLMAVANEMLPTMLGVGLADRKRAVVEKAAGISGVSQADAYRLLKIAVQRAAQDRHISNFSIP